MKKTLIGALMCGTILGGTILAGTTALAAGGVYNTDGLVTFVEDTSVNPPVDPENPDPEQPVIPTNPIDPETPVNPGTPGPLSIDYASSLNFGKQKISTAKQIYNADTQWITTTEGEEVERELYVQVTDKRGESAGWGLSVKQTAQFKTAEGDILNGAKINFLNGQLETYSESAAPKTVVADFDLTSAGNGEMVNVVSADKNEGWGTWIYRFGDAATKAESVKLEVPGASVKKADKAYTTEIVWTLTDIPGNGEEEGGE